MKIQLMKKTLAVLVLGGLGLVATGAQADGNREGYGYIQMHGGYDRHASYDHRAHQDRRAFQQSAAFGQQINARQDRQMDRIRAGMRSGALTRGEFRELMREQHQIRTMERHVKADGLINTREFQRLDRALDMASHNIRDEKHDRQARNAYGHNARFN
ncbi:MAG: hypothetical protein ACYCZA_14625 [Thiobacillus sp.]